MLRWIAVPFVLACVCLFRPSVKANKATGLEALVSKDSHQPHPRQQVSSWSPFSQWRWFNPVLSLRENQIDEEPVGSRTVASAIQEANSPLAEGDEDSMLSVVLLLGEEEEKNDRAKNVEVSRENSKRLVSSPPSPPPPPPPPSPFAKRSRACVNQSQGRCRRGQVSMIPAEQVQQDWEDDYSSVPDVLIQFSQQQAEEAACNDLSVQLFQVDLREHYLEPVWVREIVHLGMCPSKLQMRNFGKDVWPSSVVETKCLCHNQPCSNLGGDFRCQAVRRPIPTWVRHVDNFMPVQEMVTVGCVCVQRTSPEGKYAKPSVES